MVAYGLTPVWGSFQFLPSALLQAAGQTFALSGVVFFGILHLKPQDALTFGGVLQTARLLGGEMGTACRDHRGARARTGSIELDPGSTCKWAIPNGDSAREGLRRRDHARHRSGGRRASRRTGARGGCAIGGHHSVGDGRFRRDRVLHRAARWSWWPDSEAPAGTALPRCRSSGKRSSRADRHDAPVEISPPSRPSPRSACSPWRLSAALPLEAACRVGPNYHAPAVLEAAPRVRCVRFNPGAGERRGVPRMRGGVGVRGPAARRPGAGDALKANRDLAAADANFCCGACAVLWPAAHAARLSLDRGSRRRPISTDAMPSPMRSSSLWRAAAADDLAVRGRASPGGLSGG